MKQKGGLWQHRAFMLAFVALTFFCWCPIGYGIYGEAPGFLGIPAWAVVAVGISAVLFVLEWIYLFHTRMAMHDEDVPDIVSQLEAVDTARQQDAAAHEKADSAKEDE